MHSGDKKFWKKHGKAILVWVLVLAALLVALKMTLLAPYRVQAVSLTPRDLQAEAFGVGTVEAKVVVSVGSKITGRLTTLTVDQGDRVKRGQLVATLENDDFREQAGQAEQDLGRADADLVANQAATRQAEANLDLARKNFERYRNLFQKDVVARLEFEQKENEYIVAREALKSVQAQRVSLEKQRKRSVASRGFARAKLADTFIYAPCDGVVVSREAELGDAVVAGAPILRIADAEAPIWVVAHIDETVAGGIRVGQPARVVLRSRPKESLSGRVARVEVESDRVTEEKAVDVTFALPAHVPPIGEQADVYVVTARKAKVPALPRGALVPVGKKFGVWLVRNGRVHLREVEVGASDPSGWVEIRGGLAKGDKVAVAPPEVMAQLTEGAKVSVP